MFRRSGSSFDLKSIREYQGSDDPRRIDWRLAARSGRLYVKEYFEEEREGAVILVDLSASMGVLGRTPGEGDLEARRIAATVAWMLGALGLPTSLLAFAAKPLRRLDRPRGGLSRRPIESFFAALATRGEESGGGSAEGASASAGPARGLDAASIREAAASRQAAASRLGTDIGAALASARASCRYRRLVLISDFFDRTWKPAASPFSRNSFIRLYRPLDDLFTGALELDVRDPESGERLRLPWDRTAEIAYRERERELDGLLGEAARRGAFCAAALPGGDRPALYWDFLEALYA
jgi:uncharacterized protein (DUF58 family)